MKISRKLTRLSLTFLAVLLGAGSLIAHAGVETPPPGSPLRKAILNDLRAETMFVQLSQEVQEPIVFMHVTVQVSGEWAWIQAAPSWHDGKEQREPTSGLMHRVGQKWSLVTAVGDEIASADDPVKAFLQWRLGALKKHPACPPKVIPTVW